MATIPGLYATGEGFSDNDEDTHYELTYLSAGTYGDQTLGSYGFRQPNAECTAVWNDVTGTGRWVTPVQNAAANLKRGDYRWRLNFNIDSSVYDPVAAAVSLRFMADNNLKVELNGNLINDFAGTFDTWTSVDDINSGYVAGANYFDFTVNNDNLFFDTPTGLVVEFTSNFIGPAKAINAIMFSCNT